MVSRELERERERERESSKRKRPLWRRRSEPKAARPVAENEARNGTLFVLGLNSRLHREGEAEGPSHVCSSARQISIEARIQRRTLWDAEEEILKFDGDVYSFAPLTLLKL